MRILYRGRPGQTKVRPLQWANDWITGDDDRVHNPASVQLDPQDVALFDATRNAPHVGTFWAERRLDRVTLRFRSIPPDYDASVEQVAELLDEAASRTMDGLPEGDYSAADQSRVMVAMWFNRLAWHLRTGHVVPALVHEVLMAGAGPHGPWWHGPDGVASKTKLVSDNRERGKE